MNEQISFLEDVIIGYKLPTLKLMEKSVKFL
jgi:hypothetical protein